jgi:alpha-glucosidase
MDCKHTSPRMSISGMGFTGSDIGGFCRQPSGDCAVDSIGCFHPLSDTLFRGSWRSEYGHLMKTLLILLENLLTYVISCYHIYTMFWQYIEEESYA